LLATNYLREFYQKTEHRFFCVFEVSLPFSSTMSRPYWDNEASRAEFNNNITVFLNYSYERSI